MCSALAPRPEPRGAAQRNLVRAVQNWLDGGGESPHNSRKRLLWVWGPKGTGKAWAALHAARGRADVEVWPLDSSDAASHVVDSIAQHQVRKNVIVVSRNRVDASASSHWNSVKSLFITASLPKNA